MHRICVFISVCVHWYCKLYPFVFSKHPRSLFMHPLHYVCQNGNGVTTHGNGVTIVGNGVTFVLNKSISWVHSN